MSDAVVRAYEMLEAQDRAGAIAILRTADGGEAAGLLGELLLEDGDAIEAADALSRALAAGARSNCLAPGPGHRLDGGRAADGGAGGGPRPF